MKIKRTGTKVFHPEDYSGINWWLLEPTDESDESIIDSLDAHRYYGGPGRAFTCRGYVRRTSTRVLVTQRFGVDC